MKIVIPVSKSDVEHLDLLTQVIIHQGPVTGHDILLFPTPAVQEAAMDAAQKLRSVCTTVTVEVADDDYPEGWPQAPNRHWHCAVLRLEKMGNRLPWLWLEVDAVPMVKHWATKLYDAYLVGGKPFFGFTKPVLYTKPGAEQTYTKPGDDMLMGVAIYPPGIPRDSVIKPLFDNVGRRGPTATREPFDLYLRWVFKQRGVAVTGLIQDLWRTAGYRREGESIVCEAFAGENRAKGGTVPPDAVLVHGVKDGSLQRLVLGGGDQKAPKLTQVVNPEQKEVVITTPSPSEKQPSISDSSDAAMTAYLAKGKIRFKDFQDTFGLEIAPAATLVRKLGFVVKSGGWVHKAQPEGDL